MAQSAEQLQAARELAKEYGLTGADFYEHKQSRNFLISRTGIEKIQYKAGISVDFEAVRVEPDFAAVKATATRKTKADGARTATTLRIQTFGSAVPANCRIDYYLEMAEKRALSRAVLKLTDFYQLGVYGEDEMPPAVLREHEAAPAKALPAKALPADVREDIARADFEVNGKGAAHNAPGKSFPVAGGQDSGLPEASTTSDQSSAEQAAIIEAARVAMRAAKSTLELKGIWDKLTKSQGEELLAEKNAAKARIDLAIQQATKTPLPQREMTLAEPANRPDTDEQGQPVAWATKDQKQEIIRLLNHPNVDRSKKANMLLSLNKHTEARAAELIDELNKLCDTGGEGHEQLVNGLKKWIRESREAGWLPLQNADRLLTLTKAGSTAAIRTAWMDARTAFEPAYVETAA